MMEVEGAKAVAVAAGVTAVTLPAHPVFLGIPSDVLLAAFAGAMLGLAYTKPEAWGKLLDIPPGSRTKRLGMLLVRALGLVFTLAGIAVASSWGVSVAPHVPAFRWTGDIPPVPFAGFLSFAGQRLIPAALSGASKWLDRSP